MIERNYFKEKLYNHTLPVNEGMWSAIESQLPPEQTQKRFPVFWMTLFGTTLLGGALMIGFFNQNSDTALIPPPPINNEVMASSFTNQSSSADIDATGTSTSAIDNNETNESTTTSTSTLGSSATLSSAGTAESTSTSFTKTTSSAKSADATNQDLVTNQTLNTNQLIGNQNSANQSTGNGLVDTENANLSDNTLATAETARTNSDLDVTALPYRNTSMTSLLPLADYYQKPSTLTMMSGIAPDPNCYKFGDIGAHYAFSVDAIGGYGFSPKTYEENGGETADYISARKATEKSSYAWSLGARLNLHHRSGLTARLGLQYTQVGDVFDYTDSLATQTTTRIDSFFAADGTFLYTEMTQVYIDGTLVKKIHNTYRYVDIPLLVGYEMRFGRNILMLNAGPVFNLTHSYEGQILDSMLHPRSISPGEPGAIDIYKTNVGLSVYLGAGILFPLTDRLSALIEPSYLFRLNPVTKNSYELKEKRGYASLNLGIRYHIN